MGELALRMVASLAVVVGLLIVAARVAGRRFRGGAGAEIQILQRQAISRGTQIAVVQVRDRVLVIGATEQQMRLLAELDPQESEESELELPAELAGDLTGDLTGDMGDLATVTPLTLVPDPVPAPAAPVDVAPGAPVAPVDTVPAPAVPEPVAAAPVDTVTEILAGATGPYADFAAALAEQLAATAGAPAPQPVTAPAGPLTGGRVAPTDPFAPRLDRPGKHARVIAPEPVAQPVVQPVVQPALAGGIDPALALLTDLDDRAAILDLLAALPTPADGPLSAPAAEERPAHGRAAKAPKQPKAPKPAKPAKAAKPAAPAATSGDGRLAGSVLSPQTWRQAYQAVTRRAS